MKKEKIILVGGGHCKSCIDVIPNRQQDDENKSCWHGLVNADRLTISFYEYSEIK